MSKYLNCVLESEYHEIFEGVPENTIYIYDSKVSKKLWSDEIDPESSSYFDIVDDHWLLNNRRSDIARWLEAYNNDNNLALESQLRRCIYWIDDIIVRFYAKRTTVFECTWIVFLKYWDRFIAVEDDCPILIPKANRTYGALVFTPIGNVSLIERPAG